VRDRKSYQDAVEKLNWLVASLKEEAAKGEEAHEVREQVIMFMGGTCQEPNEVERVVSRDEGKEEARRLGVRFRECSAKTGEGVEEGVVELLREQWRIIEKKAGERTGAETKNSAEIEREKKIRGWRGKVAQLKGLLPRNNGKKDML